MGAFDHQDRFATVDALRGVAAIAVMLYHIGPASPIPMPGGYLAVDLFFALSGFVIAQSYAARMRDGLAFGTFMRMRIARLWPMLLLGALLGIALHGGHAGMLFLLPNPKSPTMLFPANPPLWSLLLEMVAYATFALLWRRIGMRGLMVIVATSAAALGIASQSSHPFEGFGAEWPAFLSGFARVGFSFGTGIVIWHVQRVLVRRRMSPLGWVPPVAFLIAAVAIPSNNVAALVFVLVGVPTLTWTAARWELPQRRLADVLGSLSYPLYCIHVPIIAFASVSGGWLIVLPAALVAVAYMLDRVVDRPARRALKVLLTGDSAFRHRLA